MKWNKLKIPLSQLKYPREKKLYIFITGYGGLYLFLNLICLIVSVLYNNNLTYLISFFLFSFFVVSLLLVHDNLKNVDVEVNQVFSNYAAQSLGLELKVRKVVPHKKKKEGSYFPIYGIQFKFKNSSNLVDLEENELVYLSWIEGQRGKYKIDDIKIETRYPFGMFVAWTHIFPNENIYVYPDRIKTIFEWRGSHLGDERIQRYFWGDDFEEFKLYEHGDPIRHIHWRKYAYSDQLIVKKYDEIGQNVMMIEWNQFSHIVNFEARLSAISYIIHDCSVKNINFILKLPTIIFNHESLPIQVQKTLEFLSEMKESDYA